MAMCEAHGSIGEEWLIGIRLGMRGRTCEKAAPWISTGLERLPGIALPITELYMTCVDVSVPRVRQIRETATRG